MSNRNDFSMEIKSSILKDIIQALHVVDDETLWRITPEGVNTRMVDPAHVLMADLSMSRHACESYEGGDKSIAFSLSKLQDVLMLSKKDEMVTLENNNGQEKLHVRFGPIHRRIPLLDQETMKTPSDFPKVDWTVKTTLKSETFQMALKATCQVNPDSFTIEAVKNELRFHSEQDLDDVSIKLVNGESGQLSLLDVSADSVAMYSQDYMDMTLKAAHGDSTVSAEFATDNPMLVSYGFADETVSVKYMIAPRVDSE